MKKAFFLLCAVLLVLSCTLPLAAYRLTRAVLVPSRHPSLSSLLLRPEMRPRLPCPAPQTPKRFCFRMKAPGR